MRDKETERLLTSRGGNSRGGVVLCPGETREQAVRGGYCQPSAPLLENGILDSPLLATLKPPHERRTHTHTEEESPRGEQSRAEHLDLPLLTHSGISGTDGRRNREYTLGQTRTRPSDVHKYAQTHAAND